MVQRTFYLNSIPGLESTAYLELCERWRSALDFFSENHPYPQAAFYKAAIEFQAPTHLIAWMLPRLRICQRMLLREDSFPAADEKSFVNGLTQVKWSDIFKKGDHFEVKFTSRSSRISQSRQVQDCLKKVLKPYGVRWKKGGRTLFIRLFRDDCQVSYDLTGTPAYERGQGSVASLRPTTAAGLLRILLQGLESPVTLVDPMCGSGTFLVEALQLHAPLQRSFAMSQFPLFQALNMSGNRSESSSVHGPVSQVYGFDSHDKAVELARKNGRSLSSEVYQVAQADLFDREQGRIPDDVKKPVVIINPPWGQRLPTAGGDWLSRVVEKYQPQRLGLLMPAHWRLQPIAMEKTRDVRLVNSGVENRFVCFST